MQRKLIITGWPFAVCSIHATTADDFKVGEEVKLISPQHKVWSNKMIQRVIPQGANAVLIELM